MSETISACQNICQDFAWVAPTTEWLRNVAICIGVVVGWYQLSSWRREKISLRRSEIAEELIALAFNAEDAFRNMRSRLSSIPKDKLEDKLYPYEERYKRVFTSNELFKNLRDAQIRVRAVIGDSEVDEAANELFKARNSVAFAIEEMANLVRDGDTPSPEDREFRLQIRRDLYGSFDERDELGTKIISAVKKIEEKLSPVARLEARK